MKDSMLQPLCKIPQIIWVVVLQDFQERDLVESKFFMRLGSRVGFP